MTEQTKTRALKALALAKYAGGENYLFPMCFVCGEHIFFTYMAAYRQKMEYQFLYGENVDIELVRTPLTQFVNWDADQRGDVKGGEIFPNREYKKLLKMG